MKLRVVKLNGKYRAYPNFNYALVPDIQRVMTSNWPNVFNFESIKQWCCQTWGDTPMFNIWQLGHHLQGDLCLLNNSHWTYDVSNRNGVPVMRLYLQGDKELSLYQLRWS